MFARRALPMLLVAALAVAACSGSEESPDPLPADPVEEAAPSQAPPVSAADSETEAAPDTESGAATEGDEGDEGDVQQFPDVVDATAELNGATWTIAATLSSPYDTPERYADAWRVVGPDGTVYGERILTHDHADEQPFTRSQSGIEIPDDVTTVTIEGRDLEFGYGGATFELPLPR